MEIRKELEMCGDQAPLEQEFSVDGGFAEGCHSAVIIPQGLWVD